MFTKCPQKEENGTARNKIELRSENQILESRFFTTSAIALLDGVGLIVHFYFSFPF